MTTDPAPRPVRIAVTFGDPAGIGPEIAVRAAAEEEAPEILLVGDPAAAAHWAGRFGLAVAAEVDDLPARDQDLPARVVAWNAGASASGANPGHPSSDTGKTSWAWLRAGIDLAARGIADALVTGPVSKSALRAAKFAHPGQTEFLAETCGVDRFAMLLAGGRLAVLPVTRHVPIREVPDALNVDDVADAIEFAWDFARRIGCSSPRIAVAALNPHAGEGGLIGTEERDRIEPAIVTAAARGYFATGPFPADSLFHRAYEGDWDVVVCMYHDQGLIPLKMLAFHDGVNITLGLPIVRVSPDHGTAFDLAGRGEARSDSMRSAIRWAARLARS